MHKRTMLMKRLTFLVLIIFAGCATRSTEEIRTALVRGDQKQIDAFTDAFLAGAVKIDRLAIADARPVDRRVIVRISEERRISQYSVDQVSDYFLCLLQIRSRTSTRELLTLPDSGCEREDECEVCNSLVYHLPQSVRESLSQYWKRRLDFAPTHARTNR